MTEKSPKKNIAVLYKYTILRLRKQLNQLEIDLKSLELYAADNKISKMKNILLHTRTQLNKFQHGLWQAHFKLAKEINE
jgi:hypothetical protein